MLLEDGLVHLLRHAALVEHRVDAVALEQAIHPLGVAEAGGGLERVDHVLAGADFGAGRRRLGRDVELVANLNRRLVALVDHVFEDAVAGGEDAAGEVDDVAGAKLADVLLAERDVEVPFARLAVRRVAGGWGLGAGGCLRCRLTPVPGPESLAPSAARPFIPSPPLVDGCGFAGLEFDSLAAVVRREPLRVVAVLDAAVVIDAGRRAAHGVAQFADADRQAAGVGVGDLAVHVEHRRVALEAHDADHRAVAQFQQLQFELGDERIGVPVADEAQAGCFLAERDALVFRAADADADDHRRARQAAMAERDQRVDEEPLDAGDAVAGEEHAVVAAEQAALVDGGEVDPVALGLEAVVDVRRHHADVGAGVAAGERMHAVGAERDVLRGPGRRRAERPLELRRSRLRAARRCRPSHRTAAGRYRRTSSFAGRRRYRRCR